MECKQDSENRKLHDRLMQEFPRHLQPKRVKNGRIHIINAKSNENGIM